MKLKIIHTNDVHSHFENFSRAATLIKELKDECSLILDGGDFADFKSIELQGTRGIAAIELLNEVGYDALTIGNNETFNGVDTLEHMASNSPIPFISNNLYRKDRSEISGVLRSTILVKNSLRLLITGSSPDLAEFNDGLGVHIRSFKEAIQDEILKNKGNYDICILLSHVGTFEDEKLAEEIEGIDIIISAHDHQLFPEAKIINGTIMNSAGNYGEHVGLVEIEVVEGRVNLVDSKTIATEKKKVDEGVTHLLKKNKEKAVEVLSRPLYDLPYPLWHDVIEENPISNLIADGLKDMLDCEIGLINSGIVNAGCFNHISDKKLIEVCPSPLNPTSFEVKGWDIQQAIMDSVDAQVCLDDGKGPGFRGKFVGRIHVSGVEIICAQSEVREIYVAGERLEEDRWYTVASSDYLQRGSGYPTLANNRNVKYLPEEIKDVIRMYAKHPECVERAQKNRWIKKLEAKV